MLSKGFMIPLSFASLPVISITFFDKKKRSRKRKEEDEIDVPPDGLSIEDLESLDLDQLQSHSEKMSERGMSPGDPGVITILPGWSFIPCITIALPRKGRFGDSLFDTAEDPGQERNLAGSALEKEMAEKLKNALRACHAPQEQFVRLGL